LAFGICLFRAKGDRPGAGVLKSGGFVAVLFPISDLFDFRLGDKGRFPNGVSDQACKPAFIENP
jgi:hypothetical protein